MRLYTAKAVADWLGITERRVRDLTREGVLLTNGNLYELKPTVRRYIQYLAGIGNSGEKTVDYNREKALLMRARREKMEMEQRKRDGELHESDEIRRVMGAMFAAFRSRVLAIPARVSPKLALMSGAADIFAVLRRECGEALAELSDFDAVFGTIDEKKEAGGRSEEERDEPEAGEDAKNEAPQETSRG